MSVVKINVLQVPAEQRAVLEERFGKRAGAVENSDGFEEFALLRPVEGTDRYLVYTRWRDEESFQAWLAGPAQAAHRGETAGAHTGGEAGAQHGGEAQHGGRRPAATGSELWSFEVVQQVSAKDA